MYLMNYLNKFFVKKKFQMIIIFSSIWCGFFNRKFDGFISYKFNWKVFRIWL